MLRGAESAAERGGGGCLIRCREGRSLRPAHKLRYLIEVRVTVEKFISVITDIEYSFYKLLKVTYLIINMTR